MPPEAAVVLARVREEMSGPCSGSEDKTCTYLVAKDATGDITRDTAEVNGETGPEDPGTGETMKTLEDRRESSQAIVESVGASNRRG